VDDYQEHQLPVVNNLASDKSKGYNIINSFNVERIILDNEVESCAVLQAITTTDTSSHGSITGHGNAEIASKVQILYIAAHNEMNCMNSNQRNQKGQV